ncbi:MAG: hypothetical protein HKO57_06485 [Akkermansiaceae bacterium]|nr:hypothetical protein [Akkermansiaceae bacterium]
MLALCGAAWAVAGYLRRGSRRRMAMPLVLRLLALALLALSLAEPAWVGQEAEPGANIVAVIADNSAGMEVRDAGERRTRADALAALMTDSNGEEAGWLETITQTFGLRRFAMDGQLRRVGEFTQLDFTGRASAIRGALESVERRFAGRPVAAVVLLTDGNATDEVDLGALGELPPVYPVVIGGEAPERDLSNTAAAVSQSSFEDAPVTVRADLVARGYSGRQVTVRLRGGDGEEIETQVFSPSGDTESQSVRFLHRPPKSGIQFYRMEIEAGGGEEATAVNNARLVTVNRGSGPYRVLYVSGRPNWEFKFLNRSLADDPEIELVGLIRVARREPKFTWRGREGETANPLFRGFNPDDDTAEFDQPVLVRLNTRDDRELSAGFPREAKDLFDYHAVVIDDLERSFFTVDQMDLLDAFVSRRGGSLLMLGGAESFAPGGYDKSPVGKMLPVHLGGASDQAPGRELRLDLTRDGWLSPWVRLRETESAERERLAGMSPFKSLNRIAAIKPGATVLAHVDDGGTRRPALAVQRFGNGRVGSLLVADLWRWGFSVPENRPDMEKAWRQVVRWLIADVPERVSLELKESGEGAVRAKVRVRDERHEPMADARVTVTVTGEDGKPVALAATASDTEAGVFEVTFVTEAAGATTVQATVTDANGLPVGETEDGWAANGAADEFRRLEPNRDLLEAIAAATGGEVLDAGGLAKFASRLPGMGAPEMRTWSHSLWHTPAVFLAVLGCFAAEWIIRRRAGMA